MSYTKHNDNFFITTIKQGKQEILLFIAYSFLGFAHKPPILKWATFNKQINRIKVINNVLIFFSFFF